MIKQTEAQLHRAVCDYLRARRVMFNTDMSGIKLTMGQAIQAKKLRSHGGFPDLMIFEQRGRYSGLFIELKADGAVLFKKDGSLSGVEHIQNQAKTHELLADRGFMVAFSQGFDKTKELIDKYLNLRS